MRSKPCPAWPEPWEAHERGMKESSSPRLRQGSEARWSIGTRRVAESAPCERAERPAEDLSPWRFRGRELHWRRAERPFQEMLLSTDYLHADYRLRLVRVQLRVSRGRVCRIHSGNRHGTPNPPPHAHPQTAIDPPSFALTPPS